MNQRLLNVATVILVVCAVTVSATVVHKEYASNSSQRRGIGRAVKDWKALLLGGRVLGPSNAPVVIVEFSDFQCPFCARSHRVLQQIMSEFPEEFAVVFRHFPLPTHPYAFSAALAAECAGEEGKFHEFASLLFERQSLIGVQEWGEFAAAAGINNDKEFLTCIAEERYKQRVQQDLTLGDQIGITGTPSFVIDGRLYTGAPALDQLREWVRERSIETRRKLRS